MKKNLCLGGLFIGGGLAMGITILGLFLLSLQVGFTEEATYYLVRALFILAVSSMLIGGFGAGFYSGNKGWLHGAIIGLVYTVAILALPRILAPQIFPWTGMLKEAFFYTSLASFAGIAGVNYQDFRLKKRRYKRNMY